MTEKALKPEDIPRLFTEAWNEHNARAIADLFIEDADFINVTGIWWKNNKDIFKAHNYGFKVIFPVSTLKIKNIKTRYLSDDIAIIHAGMQLSNQSDLEGNIIQGKRNNLFVFVAMNVGTHWLVHSAQNSEILPGKETFINKDGHTSVNYGKFKK